MFRTLTISLLSVAAVATLNAGQIQLSGSGPVNNNTAGFGLTGNASTAAAGYYIQPGTVNGGLGSCSGQQYNSANCAAPVTSGTAKGNYAMTLFTGVTGLSQALPDASNGVAPPGNLPNPSDPSGMIASTFTSPSTGSQIEFDLMNAPNGSSGYSGASTCTVCVDANYWSSSSSTGFVIPVGLANVDSVYTMLNDYWGLQNAQNITVSFCFSATSNGSCPGGVGLVNVPLQDGVEVSAAVICNASVSGSCPTTDSQNIATSLAPTSVVNGVTINTGTVYEASYTSIPTSNPAGAANRTPWAGSTSGNIVLDDQQFLFSGLSPATPYLSYIQIVDTGSGWSATSGLSGISRFALSAVTVDQAPEPASVLLLLAGLGAIGASRLRRRV